MSLEAMLCDVGNTIYFIATIPQLHRTYKNRKHLKDLDVLAFILYTIASLVFIYAGIIMKAPITIGLCSFNAFYNLLTIYWICHKA
jgi:uncharacterized protein with PQ loop repeat